MSSAVATLPRLTALGHELDTSPAAFGWLQPSNDALDDPTVLRDRLATEGYLYFRDVLDKEAILTARRSVMDKLAADGLLHPDHDPIEGIVHPDRFDPYPRPAGATPKSRPSPFRPDLAKDDPAVRAVVFGDQLAGFYAALFGEPVRHFDYIWVRLLGPGTGTPVHCDWVYMSRGSPQLLTCWIPYGEVPLEVGGLCLLERSHRQADRIRHYLDKDVDAYCSNDPKQAKAVGEEGKHSHPGWLSRRPDTLPAKFGSRWLTAETWRPGDFLTFNMAMVHGSLDNRSDRLRLSTDTRWQPASQPADERWVGANPVGHGLAGKRGRIC